MVEKKIYSGVFDIQVGYGRPICNDSKSDTPIDDTYSPFYQDMNASIVSGLGLKPVESARIKVTVELIGITNPEEVHRNYPEKHDGDSTWVRCRRTLLKLYGEAEK